MNFNINDFSGPLDLLLHMVKKEELNIYEIDLKIIIDEYISFINTLDKNDLDSKSEYLIMASELIHLKSKLLLGLDDDEKEEFEINSEEDLRQRILEYEKYKSISDEFKNLELNRKDYFTKIPESMREYVDDEKVINNTLDINELLNAFLELQQRIKYQKPSNTKITRKEISLKDKINYIRELIKIKNKAEFSELFDSFNKEELVITLLSILEMSKNNEVKLSQKVNFSKIYIEVNHE